MDRICLLCNELILDGEAATQISSSEGPAQAHQICMLREVVGGIGHLIAHEYWCVDKHDPDAGLTFYQSAKLVREYVRVVGIPGTEEYSNE